MKIRLSFQSERFCSPSCLVRSTKVQVRSIEKSQASVVKVREQKGSSEGRIYEYCGAVYRGTVLQKKLLQKAMNAVKWYQFTEKAGIWPEGGPRRGGPDSYSTKRVTTLNGNLPRAQTVGIITLNINGSREICIRIEVKVQMGTITSFENYRSNEGRELIQLSAWK